MDTLLKPFKKKNAAAKKHQKLPENWGKDKDPLTDGVTFYAKYLGNTLVDELDEGESYGEGISSKAVQTIVNIAKLAGKKLPKCAITVSKNGIKVFNQVSKEVQTNMTIFRISFCTADHNHDKVFAFISRNLENETMECQAFLCTKRKIAQAITLTVAQAFNCAKDDWEEKERKERENIERRAFQEPEEEKISRVQEVEGPVSTTTNTLILIDDAPLTTNYDQTSQESHSQMDTSSSSQPVDTSMGFEDSFNDYSVEDDFSCLAQSRSDKKTPASPFGNFSMGLRPEDIEEGVDQLMAGGRITEEMTRAPSMDDLFTL